MVYAFGLCFMVYCLWFMAYVLWLMVDGLKPFAPRGYFVPDTTATGNDRPGAKTIVEGNP